MRLPSTHSQDPNHPHNNEAQQTQGGTQSASTLWRPEKVDAAYLNDPVMVRVLERIAPEDRQLYLEDPEWAAGAVFRAYDAEKKRPVAPNIDAAAVLPNGVKNHLAALPDGRLVCFKHDDEHVNGMRISLGAPKQMEALRILNATHGRDGSHSITTNAGTFKLFSQNSDKNTFDEVGSENPVEISAYVQNKVLASLSAFSTANVGQKGKTYVGGLPDGRVLYISPDEDSKLGVKAYLGRPEDMKSVKVLNVGVLRDGGTRVITTSAGTLTQPPSKPLGGRKTDQGRDTFIENHIALDVTNVLQHEEDAALSALS